MGMFIKPIVVLFILGFALSNPIAHQEVRVLAQALKNADESRELASLKSKNNDNLSESDSEFKHAIFTPLFKSIKTAVVNKVVSIGMKVFNWVLGKVTKLKLSQVVTKNVPQLDAQTESDCALTTVAQAKAKEIFNKLITSQVESAIVGATLEKVLGQKGIRMSNAQKVTKLMEFAKSVAPDLVQKHSSGQVDELSQTFAKKFTESAISHANLKNAAQALCECARNVHGKALVEKLAQSEIMENIMQED